MGRNSRDQTHCGVYLDLPQGGRIIHADEPHGVVLDDPVELRESRRWRLMFLVPA